MTRFLIGVLVGFNIFPLVLLGARYLVDLTRERGNLKVHTKERREMGIREGWL